MTADRRKLTRRELASGLAHTAYPNDLGSRDLLGRLLERELARSYDALGNRKDR